MDVGTVMSAAQSLFTALQCSELKKICSIFGYKSQLDDLQRTVFKIKAVLRDAEAKKELSDQDQLYIEDLKDAVYEADDLIDEFVTLAEVKKLTEGEKKASLLPDFRWLKVAYKVSRGVKKFRKRLDDIASCNRFSFKLDLEPIIRRRPETCSYVYAVDIIGREDDLEKIIGMLLKSDVQQVERDVSFLSIVGIGGLGKTALTQLVFNNARIKIAFPLRLWTCVSDQDNKKLDVKEILGKILESATGQKHEASTMDSVQSQLREQLAGRKYLLVLDDVWTENRGQWRTLAGFLMGGQKGSWVVVTTRSQETARVIGDGPKYELQGLSERNSQRLLERMASGSNHSNLPQDLVEIGREIVKGCASVPLAIRVAGSLLYGQDKSRWLSFLKTGQSNIRESQNDIMPILKLSYHHLESSLKSCFSYCALFPKDFVIEKQMLISLWMAQGYIVPLDEGQSTEDAAEEYFSILLRRCFFQDVVQDKYGNIISCKIHDLMHDIAQKVAEKEMCVMNTVYGKVDTKTRHLSTMKREFARYSFTKTRIRSYLHVGKWYHVAKADKFSVDSLLTKNTRLRALDLKCSGIKGLPSTISELLHLRYLDLSENGDMEVLPKSITRLHNLETLKLSGCFRLKRLPKHTNKLIKLRALDIEGCYLLSCMPPGMGKLTCLHTLPEYVLSTETCSSLKHWVDQLQDLKVLNKLKDNLTMRIQFPKHAVYDSIEDGVAGGAYLRNKEHLNVIKITFSNDEVRGRVNDEEALMEELQPHSNLKGLQLERYEGVRMPSWAKADKLAAFLPNLVRLHLKDCGKIQHLTSLGRLRHLKALKLIKLLNLEYIYENRLAVSMPARLLRDESITIFPSLEQLEFRILPKLRQWRWGVGLEDDHVLVASSSTSMSLTQLQSLSLSKLKSLLIHKCPELTSTVLCPNVKDLSLLEFNGVQIMKDAAVTTTNTPVTPSSPSDPIPKLDKVLIDNVAWLNTLSKEAFQSLTEIRIWESKEMESLGDIEDVFHTCSSSLRSLYIEDCLNLRSVFGGLEHLTALDSLFIRKCPNMRLSEERADGMPWKSLHCNLCYLMLWDLPQLEELPNWMQFLGTLQTLEIRYCQKLESLPNWMPKITSIRELRVCNGSARLKERCQNPSGEDWPKVLHIPSIVFTDW